MLNVSSNPNHTDQQAKSFELYNKTQNDNSFENWLLNHNPVVKHKHYRENIFNWIKHYPEERTNIGIDIVYFDYNDENILILFIKSVLILE